jgi:pilus assembly protein Flp/PilA
MGGTDPERRSSTEGKHMQLISYIQSTIGGFLRARFGQTERGASLVEYALLVALIAVACIVAISFVGTAASTKFSSVGSTLS